ncbi:hypothetical protein N7457_005562 [Penicillium paradoxum]|uniref:uncharacterized protein n=1 Tax=Penicillium paradoxum TaxID=176176 RepID=UPI00254907EE|nr:uncharacterized protein N7457_005562 [Penicillium paradoxum]KAJ5780402.1 hypothetical protein N7457_005562 [Penicillium paradoxum]
MSWDLARQGNFRRLAISLAKGISAALVSCRIGLAESFAGGVVVFIGLLTVPSKCHDSNGLEHSSMSEGRLK